MTKMEFQNESKLLNDLKYKIFCPIILTKDCRFYSRLNTDSFMSVKRINFCIQAAIQIVDSQFKLYFVDNINKLAE